LADEFAMANTALCIASNATCCKMMLRRHGTCTYGMGCR